MKKLRWRVCYSLARTILSPLRDSTHISGDIICTDVCTAIRVAVHRNHSTPDIPWPQRYFRHAMLRHGLVNTQPKPLP